MRVIAHSQEVPKPSYVHLAYLSAETVVAPLFVLTLLLAGIVLIRGGLEAWVKLTTKRRERETIPKRLTSS